MEGAHGNERAESRLEQCAAGDALEYVWVSS